MAEYVCKEVTEHELCGDVHHYVSRERIVLCRDCKHGDAFCDSSSYAGMIDCTHFAQWDYDNDDFGIWPIEPDGFCAWGKERDGE